MEMLLFIYLFIVYRNLIFMFLDAFVQINKLKL